MKIYLKVILSIFLVVIIGVGTYLGVITKGFKKWDSVTDKIDNIIGNLSTEETTTLVTESVDTYYYIRTDSPMILDVCKDYEIKDNEVVLKHKTGDANWIKNAIVARIKRSYRLCQFGATTCFKTSKNGVVEKIFFRQASLKIAGPDCIKSVSARYVFDSADKEALENQFSNDSSKDNFYDYSIDILAEFIENENKYNVELVITIFGCTTSLK